MKVTHVSIRATHAARNAGRPELTPELLAASGARYSRNNDGLEAILSKIDPENLDKSVDAIFNMIDYGHQSIADMAPVAMFVDGISLWLAYYIWTLCPTAGGQESSTRYIKLSIDGLIPSEALGLDSGSAQTLSEQASASFDAYQTALSIWSAAAQADPSIANIPASLTASDDPKAIKQVARMRRNFAFDRARYYLPSACSTNMMLVMSARGWVTLCQHLLSHPLREANAAGEKIREELGLCAPRMLRHAVKKSALASGLADEFSRVRLEAASGGSGLLKCDNGSFESPCVTRLSAMEPSEVPKFRDDLAFHDTRYGWFGDGLRRTSVSFGWDAVAFAELRDLNRHRTGSKWCPFVPVGFYGARDQYALLGQSAQVETLRQLESIGARSSRTALEMLVNGDPRYVYWTVLGTQVSFEHTTTADKFLYEAELRTGTGAHYRYAAHLHDALQLWFAKYPETEGLVLEGTAEPE